MDDKNMHEPEAAVAIVRAGSPEESILLIRRAHREGDPWSGHWSFPGGRRDRQDFDLLHTALRELAEECGICLERECVQDILAPTLAGRRTGRFVLVAPFSFHVDATLPTVLEPREAVEAVWTPLRVLGDPEHHGLSPVPGLPAHMLFPSVQLNGTPLWGFTYRVITDWLGMVPRERPLEEIGFEMAEAVLDLVLSLGSALDQSWIDRGLQEGPAGSYPLKVASVRGSIPVKEVLERLPLSGRQLPAVFVIEVQPDRIRLQGLAFEEYHILARP
jgi:8-oxo-dGTP pyrophosphatase MutT (NUDIX family)